MQWNASDELADVTQRVQEMNLEQIRTNETYRCRICKERFSLIGWNTHNLQTPVHNVVDVYKHSTGDWIRSA